MNTLLANIDLAGTLTKYGGQIISAFGGALMGAVVAFMVDRLKEKHKREREEHGAIVRTQLALIGQLGTIRNIQRQALDNFRNVPNREFQLIEFSMTDTSLRVAYDSVSFLLMTKNPELVLEIHSAEQSYLSAMECLKSRNEAYLELHKKSKLDEINMQTGQCKILIDDSRAVKKLKDLTDHLYAAMDRAQDRLSLQIVELFKAGKALYTKKKYLEIKGEK